jgi:hypothetical protein
LVSGVVLFGGLSDPGFSMETWLWNGGAWTQSAASGPSARGFHAMATLNGKVVLFGGSDDTSEFLGDTWEWDGIAWTQRRVKGPPARGLHAMATR